MSTTIDQRVVEMRFDNKMFERNVSDTMSTLDKLKQKLNFKGASKGLENINTATKNVNMAGLGGAVEQVSMKFSALQVMGVTALSEITRSAMNTGKRIVSALTIDPVRSGFQEYETQINSVQTILANTEHAGTTIADVNKALDELNTYADQTIYNFTEMTRNIGTFTAAGIDLDTSTSAIKGIANLAAVSGSTSQQASTAMYQLSQALAAGRVSLMDWNSVVNAGMGGKVFQDALTRTSEVMGTGAEAAIKKYGSFRESLTQGEWLTTEVLTETLRQFTMAAEEGSDEWNAFKDSLREQGYTEEQAVAILKMANTASEAATKVKTFTQLWDVLKESAQSGWSQTWKLIVGDYEEAKELLSPIADVLTGFINRMSKFRNDILDSALGRGLSGLGEKIDAFIEPAVKAAEVVEDLGDIVNKVIRGDYGNGKDRITALTEAGYNYYRVQNKVNETLNCSKRYTKEQIEAQDKLLGKQANATETTKEQTKATVKLTDEQKNNLKNLAMMTEEEMKAAGYNKDQIKAMKELGAQAAALGIPMDEFIDNLDQINGRWLLMNGIKNVGRGIVDVFSAMGRAWKDVFPGFTVENLADGLFNAITAFHKFTAGMASAIHDGEKFTATGEKLIRTFRGVFALFDLVTTIVGGAFKIAFKIAGAILDHLGISILDITAIIGDAIVYVRDFVDGILNVSGIAKFLVPLLKSAAEHIKDFVESVKDSKWFGTFCDRVKAIAASFKELVKNIPKALIPLLKSMASHIKELAVTIKNSKAFASFSEYIKKIATGFKDLAKNIGKMESFKNLVSTFKKVGSALRDWVVGLKDAENIAGYIISGLAKGISKGAPEVIGAIFDLAKGIISGICDVLQIHSPSKVMIALGGFIVAGLVQGILGSEVDLFGTVKEMAGGLFDGIKETFTTIVEWIQGIDFSAIFAGLITAGAVFASIKIAGALSSIADAFGGVGEAVAGVCESVSGAIDEFAGVLKATAFNMKMEGAKEFAKAILIVAIALYIIAAIDKDKLLGAVGVLVVVAGILIGVVFLFSKIAASCGTIDWKAIVKFSGLAGALVGLAIAVTIITLAVKSLGSMEKGMWQGVAGVAVILGMLALLFVAIDIFLKGKTAKNIRKFSSILLMLSVTLLVITSVVKQISKLDWSELGKGAAFLGGFLAFVALLTVIGMIPSKGIKSIGKTMVSISFSLLLMIAVVKLASKLKPEELLTAGVFLLEMLAFIGVLGLIGGLGGKGIEGVGKMMFSLSISLLLMVAVMKLIGRLEPEELERGLLFLEGMMWFIGVLAVVGGLGGKAIEGVGKMMLSLSVSMLLMIAVMKLIGMMSPDELIKGGIAIAAFAALVKYLVSSLSKLGPEVPKVAGTIIALATAIGILAIVAVLLGLIDPTTVWKGIGAVAALVLLMRVLVTGTKNAKDVLKPIIALTVAIAVMAGAVALLSLIDPTRLAIATGCLSALMGLFALVLFTSQYTIGAMKGIIAITVAIAAIGGVLYLLSTLPVENVIGSAIALGGLMLVMSGVLALMIPIGKMSRQAIGGAIALTALALPMLAFALILKGMTGTEGAIQNAVAISTLMLSFSAALVPLAFAGSMGPAAIVGVANLIAVVTALALFIALVGDLVGDSNEFEGAIDRGIAVLVKLAEGIGTVIASFITAFCEEIRTLLPNLGANLSEFMDNVTPFIDGAKNIDESVLLGIGFLSAAIIALGVADFITAILTLGGSSLVQLGFMLSGFMIAAQPFFMGLKSVNPNALLAVKALAEAVLILGAANVIDGLMSLLGGENALDKFANELPVLGTGIRNFLTNVGTLSDAEASILETAADSVKYLAEASAAIPNTGGLLADLVGDNTLGTFADDFPKLGEGLAGFISKIGTFGEAEGATVEAAGTAVGKLATAAKEIPNSGGWVAKILGDNDLGTFAENFPKLGTGLAGLISEIGTFGEAEGNTVGAAGDAVEKLATAAKTIPNTGGWVAKILGDNDLGTFADSFPKLGSGLADFIKNVGTFGENENNTVTYAAAVIIALATAAKSIDNQAGWEKVLFGDDSIAAFAGNFAALGTNLNAFVTNLGTMTSAQVTSVEKAVEVIEKVTWLANYDLSSVASHIGTLSSKLGGLGTGISDFCANIPESSKIETAVAGLKKIVELVGLVANAEVGALGLLAKDLERVAGHAVDNFVNEFSDFEDKHKVKSAAKTLKNKAVSGLDGIDDDTEEAGKDFGEGLIKGIESKEFAVYWAAYDLGKKAVQGEKDGQKSKSPSKLTIQSGKWFGEGLVIGIQEMSGKVYSAGHALGDTAVKSLSSTVSRIATAIDTDVDVQPTIRPVLDLSDIRSGAKSIGGMLGNGTSIGVMSNLGAINTAMSLRGQNGGNDDVVSAIDKLRKEIGNVGATSYTIGGITYDDGSNIASAVRDITRYARMERRV